MQAERLWNLSSSAAGGAREFQGTKMFRRFHGVSRKRTLVIRGGGVDGGEGKRSWAEIPKNKVLC